FAVIALEQDAGEQIALVALLFLGAVLLRVPPRRLRCVLAHAGGTIFVCEAQSVAPDESAGFAKGTAGLQVVLGAGLFALGARAVAGGKLARLLRGRRLLRGYRRGCSRR